MAVEVILKTMFLCSPSVLHIGEKCIIISFTGLTACLYCTSVTRPGDVVMLIQCWLVLDQQLWASSHSFNQHHRSLHCIYNWMELGVEALIFGRKGDCLTGILTFHFADHLILQLNCKWLEELIWNTKLRRLNQRLVSVIKSPDLYFLSYSWTQFLPRKWVFFVCLYVSRAFSFLWSPK